MAEINFNCPHCNQELTADSAMAGNETQCPTCSTHLTIPSSSVHIINPMASSAAAREERHFSVPVHDAPTEILVTKTKKEEIIVSPTGEKTMRIRCIRRSDCIEVGKDRFEEIASETLRKIGEENVVSINTVNYSHIDMGTRQLLNDFGLLIVYKG